MPFSLYDVTVPVFIKNLQVLAAILEKGVANGKEDALLQSKLIEDMQAFPYQIQRVSDTAKGVVVRLTKLASPPVWEDNEKTVPELQERIAKTIAFLKTVDPKAFDASEDIEIELFGTKMTGKSYVNTFAVPNFYFHFVTAYALLRKEGTPIGKADYMGRFLQN